MTVPLVIGLDEAGRGPLAGPVCAGAVVLPPFFPVELLNDSKKLSPKKREAAGAEIKKTACWGIGIVSHEEIDRINILQASLKAMEHAYQSLLERLPDWLGCHGRKMPPLSELSAIVDGTQCPDISCPVRSEVRADGHYPCVMAASILAKLERDRIMCQYDLLYPEYGYARHKGYPTAEHRKICRELGPSPIQRRSFHF